MIRTILILLLSLSQNAFARPVVSDAMGDIIRQAFLFETPVSQPVSFSTAISTSTPTPSLIMSRTVRPVLIRSTTTDIATPTFTPTPTPTPTQSQTRIIHPELEHTTSMVNTISASSVPTTTMKQRFLIAEAPKPTPKPVKRDPLVFDMNHDGNVSASKNTGISMDPNDWMRRVGGATGGDKMLAMCDLNKNNVIDGSEVFGDLTKFPLLPANQPTYNGFIALRMVARALEAKFSNIFIVRLYNGSYYVMLDQMKKALKRMDCDLGFISDENRDPTKLEPLGDALAVDISKWTVTATENIDLTGVAHYQQGRFMDQEGRHWKANDVWFKD